MKLPRSKIGLTVALLYLLMSSYFILTQGLFGESFVTLKLGLPWSYLFYVLGLEPGGSVFSLYALLLTPIILNAFFIYWIGVLIQIIFFKDSK